MIKGEDANLGPVLFRCRLKTVSRFLLDINRKASHLPEPIMTLTGAAERLMPYCYALIFAGIPSVCTIGLVNGLFGPAATPKTMVLGIFATALAIAIWWYWAAPRNDFLIVHENGFRWRIWISNFGFFPHRGSLNTDQLVEFRYRADWQEQVNAVVRTGTSTGEKFATILVEIGCGKHELVLTAKDGKTHSVENILARFDHKDIQRFLNHVTSKRENAMRPLNPR